MDKQEQEHVDGQISLQFVKDLLPFAMLIVSGLVWGMKLEARYDKIEVEMNSLEKEVSSLQTVVDRGVLPITAEKLIQLSERISKLERDCVEHGVTSNH